MPERLIGGSSFTHKIYWMRRVFFYLFLISICTAPLLVSAQSRSELERQRAEIQKEIEDVRRSLNQTKKNRKESLGQLALLQKKLKLREDAINNISRQINTIQTDISQSRNEISRLRGELDTLKLQYEKSIVYAYKNRNNYDFLNFIFSAANFNDALKRVEYLKTYRNYREQHAVNIKNTQELLSKKISSLENSRKEKDEVLQKQEKEKMVLVEEKKEKDVFLSKLKLREKELSRELNAKTKADAKLKSGIAAAIRRETERAKAEAAAAAKKKAEADKAAAAKNPASGNEAGASTASTAAAPKTTAKKSVFDETPGGEIISDNFEKNRGKLPWPIDRGNIKIHFGTYSIPGTTLKGSNPGLTLETEEGASVKAIFDGDVITVFDIDGATAVVVRHGRYFTSYSNLTGVNVSKGSKVKAGQTLGRAGGNADGNGEIEFLLMQESKQLDPEGWIRKK